jgi:flagellar protein FlaI
MIISGGTGSGKTMLLNALSVFIPERERIISIEDTLEVNLFKRDNWVQLETRSDSGFNLDDLLKNSIRMRPDRILVGEVRVQEALTMFTAMDIGHQGLMCTLHANSARETVMRLQTTPMNVPVSLFSLLDLIIMEHRMYCPRKGLTRRVTQISEVSVMDERVLLNDIFMLNRETDVLDRTSVPSRTFEKLAFLTGLKVDDIRSELESRTNFLNSLIEDKIFDYGGIKSAILDYRAASLGKKK